MDTKKEIARMLRKLFDDGESERIGGISQAMVFNLDKLLWNYHKSIAKDKGLDTSRSGWFMSLCVSDPIHQYVRDAIEILTDVAKHDRRLTYMASEILIDSYAEYLNEFLVSLSE